MQENQTFLQAENLGLKRFRKFAFCNISLSVKPHQIIAISGEHGSGKSALLLTLSGYMKFTDGTLRICDAILPRDKKISRPYVALGLFNKLNDFYDTQTIQQVLLGEMKLALKSNVFREQNKDIINDKTKLEKYAYNMLSYWKVFSPRKTKIGDLMPCERIRLAIALALLKKPYLLFVDNIETELTSEQSNCLLEDIRSYMRDNYCSCLIGILQSDLENKTDKVLSLKNINSRVNGDGQDAC